MLDYKKYGIGKILMGYLIIIILTLVVSLASIFMFAFTLAPKLKGFLSVSVFLIIPLLYILVAIYVFRKVKRFYNLVDKNIQFRLDLCKQTLVYIIIMLLGFFIFLLFLYFPLEKRGTNEIPLNLTIQPYTFNESLVFYNEINLSRAKKIYSGYNITLNFNSSINLQKNLNQTDKELIFSQNCTAIEKLYDLTNYQNTKTVKLIFIDYNGSIDGMAHFCGKGDLIVMSTNSTIAPGWVLAHELGHVLSAEKKCWKFNLMKEYSRECFGANWITHDFIRDFRPDFLNQKQVNALVTSIRTRF
jgi:hypothetical protein